MWIAAAAAAAQSNDGLVVAVMTLAGGVVAGVVTIVVALINRSARTSPSPPPAVPGPTPPIDDEIPVRERIRVLEFRADARDNGDEIRDHRVGQHEWVIDQICQQLGIDPKWRHR